MPADQRQFEKKAERSRPGNRHIDIPPIEGVEKIPLRLGIGFDAWLQGVEHMEQGPGGNQRRPAE